MSDLKKQLKNLNVSKLKMKNGNTVEKELKRHAAILADCIMEELNNVYDSYTPKVYERSYGLYNSLYIDEGVHLDIGSHGAGLSIGLHFDDGAMHDSFTGGKVNTAILLNEGWQTRGSFSHVPYLGYREGTHFIEKGIMRYKRVVRNPFTVRLVINNKERTF